MPCLRGCEALLRDAEGIRKDSSKTQPFKMGITDAAAQDMVAPIFVPSRRAKRSRCLVLADELPAASVNRGIYGCSWRELGFGNRNG